VRVVGQYSRQRPHSVQVYMSSICFHVKSVTVEMPNRVFSSTFSRSMVGSFPGGSSLAKKTLKSDV
jgi:hypothetical protein